MKSEELALFHYELVDTGDGFDLVPTLKPNTVTGPKAKKEHAKMTAIIEVDGHQFQADTQSINFMSSVLSIANFYFNKAVAGGTSPADAYQQVYMQTIPWKDANNEWQNVTVEQIGNNLQSAMDKVKEIISEY